MNIEHFLAENVMGWKPECVGSTPVHPGYTPNCWMAADCVVLWMDEWHPLENIHQAWMLIDKLSAYPQSYCFVVCQPNDGNQSAVMVFDGDARPYYMRDIFLHLKSEDEWASSETAADLGIKPAIRVQAKTATEAICLAAAMIKWREIDLARLCDAGGIQS